MAFQVVFYDAVRRYLRSLGIEVVDVFAVEQDKERRGGACSTCSYETCVITVRYESVDGFFEKWDYEGDMGEFIRLLD